MVSSYIEAKFFQNHGLLLYRILGTPRAEGGRGEVNLPPQWVVWHARPRVGGFFLSMLINFRYIFRWFFRPNSENANFVKCMVFYWKNNDFHRSTPSFFHVFFDLFLVIFRHRVLYGFVYDFGNNFGSIFHPFSILWPSFWHIFSVSIFSWFLDAILDHFWLKIWSQKTNRRFPRRHLFWYLFVFFSGLRSRHRFLMVFDGFGSLFGRCFMDFNAFSHLWRTSFE